MKVKVAYLTSRSGTNGRVRWYWQPSADLRRHGYRLMRLPDDEAQAIAEARRRNAEVEAWRRGELPSPAAPTVATASAPPSCSTAGAASTSATCLPSPGRAWRGQSSA